MASEQQGKSGLQSRLVFMVPALWSITLVVAGAIQFSAPWGKPTLALGLVCILLLAVFIMLRLALAAVFSVLLVSALALIGAGLGMQGDASLIGPGVLGLIVLGATYPIAARQYGDSPSPVSPESSSDERTALLRQIHEHSMLSDNAKRILFRERELGLLRQAIETDLAHGKYNAGLALCDEMGEVFGYREEAEAFRSRILQAGQERRGQEIQTALIEFDRHLATRDWRLVYQEAARFRRLYPDAYQAQQIEHRIIEAREQHKRELESLFMEAASRDDVPQAMDLLRQLDRYMARDEAGRLSEVAQQVVARHRDNLGTQFKLAVSDKRWAEAAQIGNVIIAEFPNTKMAEEVRTMQEVLHSRAGQVISEPADE